MSLNDYKTRDFPLFLGHFSFFSSLFLINNPFVSITAAVKFPLFAIMLSLALLISIFYKKNNDNFVIFSGFIFAIFYIIASFRLNNIDNDIKLYYQSFLSCYTIIISMLFWRIFDVKLLAQAIFWISLPTNLFIIYNFHDLQIWEFKDIVKLGNISYDSYQEISFMFALGGLSALPLMLENRVISLRWFFYAVIFSVYFVYIFLGLGRGEGIAFTFALLIFISPIATILLFPVILIIMIYLIYFIDVPLTVRMRSILEGDFGERDYLLGKSLQIVSENSDVIYVGGGMNYFQNYFSFTMDFYPHNMFVESLITGGVFLLVPMIIMLVFPLIIGFLRLARGDWYLRYVYALLLFVVLLMNKSGTILTFWNQALFFCLGAYLVSERTSVSRARL
jgi:hypothetical protein